MKNAKELTPEQLEEIRNRLLDNQQKRLDEMNAEADGSFGSRRAF